MFEKTLGFRLFFWITLTVLGIFLFFPLYWMFVTALKPKAELIDLVFFPKHPTLTHFWGVLKDGKIMRYLGNSMYVAIVSSLLTTIVAAYAGYSFSKFRYAGRKSFMVLILVSKIAPHAVLLLSIYLMMKNFGLLDHYLSLILAFVTFTLPVGTWTLKTYFDQIPTALIDAAKIDGAGHMKIMHTIVFPLMIPGMVSVAIYGFVWAWNDLLYSLTLITSADKRTLAPGLVLNYFGEMQDNWNSMMAASIVVSIPVTVLFIFLQRFFVQGLTSGAVKG